MGEGVGKPEQILLDKDGRIRRLPWPLFSQTPWFKVVTQRYEHSFRPHKVQVGSHGTCKSFCKMSSMIGTRLLFHFSLRAVED